MIDCHIIFNEPTDREDWLDRCVQSLQHPDVTVHVHRFAESSCVRPRRLAIMQAHLGDNWIMFADPDDYVYPEVFCQYVYFLKTIRGEFAWCAEEMINLATGDSRKWYEPHHLVAFRGSLVKTANPEGRYPQKFLRSTTNYFPEPAYCYVLHADNTRGGYGH